MSSTKWPDTAIAQTARVREMSDGELIKELSEVCTNVANLQAALEARIEPLDAAVEEAVRRWAP